MIKVVVDAMGGDYSPNVNVIGSVQAVNKIDDVEVVLVGDESVLNEQLSKFTYDKARLTVLMHQKLLVVMISQQKRLKLKRKVHLLKVLNLLKVVKT